MRPLVGGLPAAATNGPEAPIAAASRSSRSQTLASDRMKKVCWWRRSAARDQAGRSSPLGSGRQRVHAIPLACGPDSRNMTCHLFCNAPFATFGLAPRGRLLPPQPNGRLAARCKAQLLSFQPWCTAGPRVLTERNGVVVLRRKSAPERPFPSHQPVISDCGDEQQPSGEGDDLEQQPSTLTRLVAPIAQLDCLQDIRSGRSDRSPAYPRQSLSLQLCRFFAGLTKPRLGRSRVS